MTQSCWKSVSMPRFLPLSQSIKVDVLIVGGGNTGIVTAYLLKKAGLRVALIERELCGQLNTGNTTSHLTCVTDLRLEQLVKDHGRDHAQAVWDAGLAAINQIQEIISAEDIACKFKRVPGYLHASITGDKDERAPLQREAELARELGFPAEFVRQVPVYGREGIRFANQAKFHPLMYLAELVTRIPGDGSHVFELTEAIHFDGSDEFFVRVTANEHVITCQQVVIATHAPLTGISSVASAAVFQTKLAPYTTYAIGAKIPRNTAPIATFWDTSDPYYYLRVDPLANEDYAIFGGRDHKTGQAEQTHDFFVDLESLQPGQGTILKLDGQRAAVYRNEAGQVTKLSAVCPHLGCLVHWNDVETSWDCPCHGSRFDATGKVIAGPAERPLEPIEGPSN